MIHSDVRHDVAPIPTRPPPPSSASVLSVIRATTQCAQVTCGRQCVITIICLQFVFSNLFINYKQAPCAVQRVMYFFCANRKLVYLELRAHVLLFPAVDDFRCVCVC